SRFITSSLVAISLRALLGMRSPVNARVTSNLSYLAIKVHVEPLGRGRRGTLGRACGPNGRFIHRTLRPDTSFRVSPSSLQCPGGRLAAPVISRFASKTDFRQARRGREVSAVFLLFCRKRVQRISSKNKTTCSYAVPSCRIRTTSLDKGAFFLCVPKT